MSHALLCLDQKILDAHHRSFSVDPFLCALLINSIVTIEPSYTAEIAMLQLFLVAPRGISTISVLSLLLLP